MLLLSSQKKYQYGESQSFVQDSKRQQTAKEPQKKSVNMSGKPHESWLQSQPVVNGQEALAAVK